MGKTLMSSRAGNGLRMVFKSRQFNKAATAAYIGYVRTRKLRSLQGYASGYSFCIPD